VREAVGGIVVERQEEQDHERQDQDVSERIALGMASTRGSTGTGEVAYDERLFNQDTGMDSRFAVVDQYNVYSGRLFAM
jgi:SNW domain-containing protein 1